MPDIEALPTLHTIDDFVSDWAKVLMEDLKIEPQDLVGLYSELYAKSKIDPSLLVLASDAREYLGFDNSNWEYWVKRIGSAAIINSELGQRGPFKVDMGTTVYMEPNVFGVQGVDNYIVFNGLGNIIEGIMEHNDEHIGIEGDELARANQYAQVQNGARELDKMAANHFQTLLKEIVRTYDPDFQTPATLHPGNNYLEQMASEGLDPNSIRIYEAFHSTCPINKIFSTSMGGANMFYLLYDHNTGEVINDGKDRTRAIDENTPLEDSQSIVKVYHQNGCFWLAPEDNPEYPWMDGEGVFVIRNSGATQQFGALSGDNILDRRIAQLDKYLETKMQIE